MAVAHHVVVAGGLLARNSVAVSCWIIIVVTVRQTVVPTHLLGRVSAADPMPYALLFPSGAVVAGLLASALGTRLTLLLSAIPVRARGPVAAHAATSARRGLGPDAAVPRNPGPHRLIPP